MLRGTARRLGACAPLSTAIPIIAADIAFLYPRYDMHTHVSDNLPELKEAKRLLAEAGGPGSNDKKIVEQLRRAEEIFCNLAPNGRAGPDTPGYLLKDWLGVAAGIVRHDGWARTPKADKARMQMLAPFVAACKDADLSDLAVFDSFCTVVAAYADAALRIATYGDGGIGSLMGFTGKASNLERFQSPNLDDGYLHFDAVCRAVDRLLDASYNNAIENRDTEHIRSIRHTYTRLCGLRAILEIPATGSLHNSLEIIDRPARLKGQPHELLSLLTVMRAEIRARLENGTWGLECLDEQVIGEYNLALERIHFHFPRSKPDNGIKLDGMENLRDVYTSVEIAKAAYLLGIPKDPKGDAPGVYTHHASRQLSLSPILLCPSGGKAVVDASSRVHFKSRRAKNFALVEAERALKMNRALYPHDKNNLKAGYILRFVACNYAELKDYLYANGLFNSAVNVFTQHYGATSLEVAEVLRWHEAYHRFVGSTQEADAQLGRINRIRAEEHGLEPVESLAAAGTQKQGIQSRAMDTKH